MTNTIEEPIGPIQAIIQEAITEFCASKGVDHAGEALLMAGIATPETVTRIMDIVTAHTVAFDGPRIDAVIDMHQCSAKGITIKAIARNTHSNLLFLANLEHPMVQIVSTPGNNAADDGNTDNRGGQLDIEDYANSQQGPGGPEPTPNEDDDDDEDGTNE